MTTPNHNIFDDEHQYNPSEQWDLTCSQCFKTISAFRPPIFNPENWHYCSCVEDPAEKSQNVYETNLDQTQSYASSLKSAPCIEGPEREANQEFLPLGPDRGLNESQHRRSASFRSEMSFQIRMYLADLKENQRGRKMEEEETEFLSQEVHILWQRKERKRSEVSWRSSSDEGIEAFMGARSDVVAGVGAWDVEGGCEGAGGFLYPMVVSGFTERSAEEGV